jgi:hypothetical protein
MGILLQPKPGYAIMTALTDTAMREITGQAGIMITAADRITMNVEADTISYGDDDGTDGTPGYLSLNNVTINGYADFKNPVSFNISTKVDHVSDLVVTGIDVHITEVEIRIDKFEIESITVGPEPGTGPSFGSFSMTDYRALISGNVRVTSH